MEVKFSLSARGNQHLLINNYNYYVRYIGKNGDKTWKCMRVGCFSRVRTSGGSNVIDMERSKFDHNHEPTSRGKRIPPLNDPKIAEVLPNEQTPRYLSESVPPSPEPFMPDSFGSAHAGYVKEEEEKDETPVVKRARLDKATAKSKLKAAVPKEVASLQATRVLVPGERSFSSSASSHCRRIIIELD